jgi:general secretion pathway protein C
MSSRWIGFFVWALAAASTAFWGLKIFAATRPVPPSAQTPAVAVPRSAPLDRLFGVVAAPAAAIPQQHAESERYQLTGVIAPRPGADARSGVAIVSIDSQPARAWHVGATLDGNTTLLSVSKRGADFGPAAGPSAFTLSLPEPQAAAIGTLPAAAVPRAPAAPRYEPALPVPGMQTPNTLRENAQHVAQPGLPRFGARGAMQAPMTVPSNVVPPGRTAPLPGQAEVQPQGEAPDGASQ